MQSVSEHFLHNFALTHSLTHPPTHSLNQSHTLNSFAKKYKVVGELAGAPKICFNDDVALPPPPPITESESPTEEEDTGAECVIS